MNLFGRKKAAPEPPKPQVHSTLDSIAILENHMQTLTKQLEFNEKKLDLFHKNALECKKKGDTNGAKMWVKRKMAAQASINRSYAMIENIETQKSALQEQAMNAQQISVLAATTATMKYNQAQISVEKVDEVRADFEEAMSDHQQMNDELSQVWGSSAVDDDDLIRELDALDDEIEDSTLHATPAAAAPVAPAAAAPVAPAPARPLVPSLPSAPSTVPVVAPSAPTAAPVVKSMDDELAELDAL